MAKTYKILVNDGNSGDIKPILVQQGVGDKGVPVRMLAKEGSRIELQDDAKGKALAPNQVRLKRMGKDLAIYFDNSQRADVLVEDFYASPTNKPQLVGLAENGGTYEYVPQDPAVSSMPSELKDDNKPVLVSLGGAPVGDAFVLSGLPVAAAAGSGGTGWLVAGSAGAAAAAAGGGGGGGGNTGPAAPAKATGALAAESDTGYSNTDGITSNTKPFYTGKAEANKNIAITVDGNTYLGTTGPDGAYKIQLTNPLSANTYTPSIKVTDPTTGLSTTADGTPFTIDTSGTPDANESAEVKIIKLSDDTGTKTDDFITSDNTLNYQGTVTGFTANGARVRLELKNSAGTVVKTEDVAFADTGAWTWSDQATPRADGKYTLVATLVDAAGNVITGAKTTVSQTVLISASGLVAVNDTGIAVEAGGLNNTTAGSDATGNVLSNDTTVDAAVTKKVVPINGKAGVYGTLNLLEDGRYTYTVDNANATVNALRDVNTSGATTLTDTFTYTATDITGQTKDATLVITIQGANDVPKYSGSFNALVSSSSTSATGPVNLIVTDPDGGGVEDKFSVPAVLTGKYGAFSFNVANQTWAYQVDPAKAAVVDNSSEFHDLLTVTSVDGSAYRTLDVLVTGGESSTIPKIMNLLNVVGVTAVGNSTTNDSVRLLGTGEMFDLTNTATHINHVEKIDITGSGANTIKLNLTSIMQADAVGGIHKLFIDGNAGDVVQIVNASLVADTSSVAGYSRYVFANDAELLISQVISAQFV